MTRTLFRQESGPLESEAMVMGVLNQAFDVLVLRFGVQKRIYCNVSVPGTSGTLEDLSHTVLCLCIFPCWGKCPCPEQPRMVAQAQV